jgi:DNA-binding GntR family transcriptional regulator
MTEPASVVTPLDLSGQRLAASAAHARIRQLILSGRLPAGTVINQVELAAELGISRTPLREALRMLEEEGLVEAEPNRRSRVASFNGAEMDAIYGTRLLLEALAMRLTLPALAPEAVEQAGRLLDELEELGGPAAGEAWHRAHHEFHQTFMTGAPGPLFDQIVSYAQRSERYMYAEAHTPALVHARRAAEHRQIHQHVQDRAFDEAVLANARHLARTPMLILAEMAADIEPASIRGALNMISSMGVTALPADDKADRKRRRTTVRVSI